MNKTKIELNYSVIHSIIEVCHSKKVISFGVKPLIEDNEVGIRDLLKRVMLPLKDRVNHYLNIGRIISIPTLVEEGVNSLKKLNSKCLWQDREARTLIGKAVLLNLSKVSVGRQSFTNGERQSWKGIAILAEIVVQRKMLMLTILNHSLTIPN